MTNEAIVTTYLMIGAVLGFARIEIWSSRGRLLPTEDRWNAKRVFFFLWFPTEAAVLDDAAPGTAVSWAERGPVRRFGYVAGFAFVWPVPSAYCLAAAVSAPARTLLSYLANLVESIRARNRRLEESRRRAEVRRAIVIATLGPRVPGDTVGELARLVRKRDAITWRIQRLEARIVAEAHGRRTRTRQTVQPD